MSDVVTRFAPSPTGFLHIGGARTALFNWLYARHMGGKFLLRIEDTDRARHNEAAVQAIIDGLEWLGINSDEPAISQFSRVERHVEVAKQMLEQGTAYRCYSTQEEIEAFREADRAKGGAGIFISPWRNRQDHPDAPYAIRLKAPQSGQTVIHDAVQGDVSWDNKNLDDMIILRSDGTPVYNLAVAVDDHDMGVTHVIRGDDHLINAARQSLIYKANNWQLPVFAHIPLIHGSDGKKLSKRHGALGVEAYREMGYPAEALCNYLTRLGWSHGDDEFFTKKEAIHWFDLDGINKAPARLDLQKLDSVSAFHIKNMDESALIDSLKSYVAVQNSIQLDAENYTQITHALPFIREKSKKLGDLIDFTEFLRLKRPLNLSQKAQKSLDETAIKNLATLTSQLQSASWSASELEEIIRNFAEENSIGIGKILQPMRAALSAGTNSPSVFEMMELLGREECLGRIEDAIKT